MAPASRRYHVYHREELLSGLVAGLQGPISGLVYALHGITSRLVYALEEIKTQKEEAA